ncbi:hypothetical protein LOD99_10660 [Oopsacas minuta]|uniref:DUF4190 domain-containing protein n=1 Tax=Oopsacas minuta TaxID=111878 RepID=A0AAV7KI24_9METZ|nr:hypothetical protein LOD99_10660 [Oopsacas minuta]
MDTETLLPTKEHPPAYEPTAPVQQTQPTQPTAPQGYYAGQQHQQHQQQPQQVHQQPYYQYQGHETQPPYNQPQQTVITGCLWCVAFTSLLCCPIFGILALIFAFAGYDNEKRFEYERARQNAKLVKVFGGFAIGLGLSSLVFSLVVVVVQFIIVAASAASS